MTYEDLRLLNISNKNKLNEFGNNKNLYSIRLVEKPNGIAIIKNGCVVSFNEDKFDILLIMQYLRSDHYIKNLSFLRNRFNSLCNCVLSSEHIIMLNNMFSRLEKKFSTFYIIKLEEKKIAKYLLQGAKVLCNVEGLVYLFLLNNDLYLVSPYNIKLDNANACALDIRKIKSDIVYINNLIIKDYTYYRLFQETEYKKVICKNFYITEGRILNYFFRDSKVLEEVDLSGLVVEDNNLALVNSFIGCDKLTKIKFNKKYRNDYFLNLALKDKTVEWV